MKRHNGIEWDDGGRWCDANDADARIAALEAKVDESQKMANSIIGDYDKRINALEAERDAEKKISKALRDAARQAAIEREDLRFRSQATSRILSDLFNNDMPAIKAERDELRARLEAVRAWAGSYQSHESQEYHAASNQWICNPDCPRCAFDAALSDTDKGGG